MSGAASRTRCCSTVSRSGRPEALRFTPFTPLADGIHRWQIIATDRRGQVARGETRNLRIDGTPPKLLIKIGGKRQTGQRLTFTVRAIDLRSPAGLGDPSGAHRLPRRHVSGDDADRAADLQPCLRAQGHLQGADQRRRTAPATSSSATARSRSRRRRRRRRGKKKKKTVERPPKTPTEPETPIEPTEPTTPVEPTAPGEPPVDPGGTGAGTSRR